MSKFRPEILRVKLADFLRMVEKHRDITGIPIYYAIWPNDDEAQYDVIPSRDALPLDELQDELEALQRLIHKRKSGK